MCLLLRILAPLVVSSSSELPSWSGLALGLGLGSGLGSGLLGLGLGLELAALLHRLERGHARTARALGRLPRGHRAQHGLG